MRNIPSLFPFLGYQKFQASYAYIFVFLPPPGYIDRDALACHTVAEDKKKLGITLHNWTV
jgi:hypothetical protein